MIPRLTRPSRRHLAHTMHQATRRGLRPYPAATRPSPAEAARTRHLAYSRAMRTYATLLTYMRTQRDAARAALNAAQIEGSNFAAEAETVRRERDMAERETSCVSNELTECAKRMADLLLERYTEAQTLLAQRDELTALLRESRATVELVVVENAAKYGDRLAHMQQHAIDLLANIDAALARREETKRKRQK